MGKVLIIDDTAYIRTVVTMHLKKMGHEMIEAENGDEGLIAAATRLPDLILLDVMMPEKDGYQVLAELKSDMQTKNIPVIMLTSRNEKEDIIKAMKLGAADYIIKPFEPSNLLKRVHSVISKKETA